MPEVPTLLTIHEVCDLLGVTPKTARKWLPNPVRISSQVYRYKADDVMALLRQRK